MEVIDIDALAESCGTAEVSIDEVQQREGYLEIQDGHSKVSTETSINCYCVSSILKSVEPD